jgi:two-component system sensor histidine kinase RpfC
MDRSDMPFIVLTANATVDALKECEEAGMDAYLTKPVEAEQLIRTVSAVLARRKRADETDGESIDQGGSENPRLSPALRPSGPALDRHKLMALEGLGGGHEFVQELASNFISEAQKVVDHMSLAWQRDDRVDLKSQAMALRDGAGTIGANPLRDLASDLVASAENIASQRTGDVARIRSELARVQAELDSYLRKKGQSAS